MQAKRLILSETTGPKVRGPTLTLDGVMGKASGSATEMSVIGSGSDIVSGLCTPMYTIGCGDTV